MVHQQEEIVEQESEVNATASVFGQIFDKLGSTSKEPSRSKKRRKRYW